MHTCTRVLRDITETLPGGIDMIQNAFAFSLYPLQRLHTSCQFTQHKKLVKAQHKYLQRVLLNKSIKNYNVLRDDKKIKASSSFLPPNFSSSFLVLNFVKRVIHGSGLWLKLTDGALIRSTIYIHV